MRHHAASNTRGKMRPKAGMTVTTGAVFLLLILIVLRMVSVQLVHYDDNARTAAALHYQDTAQYPVRGEILAADGSKLAVTTYTYTIGITPKDLHSITRNDLPVSQIAKDMGALLGMEAADIEAAVAQTDKVYVPLKKDVSREAYDKLRAYLSQNDIGGVAANPEMKRIYPNPDLGPEVVGFTNKQDRNLSGVIGLENAYNSLLTGRPGFQYSEVDNYSKSELYFSSTLSQRSENGLNLVTNIQPEIQRTLENELETITRIYNPQKGAVAIVMDPKTGAVLAMGQSGTFDPNHPMGVPKGLPAADIQNWDPSNNQDQTNLLTSRVWLNRAVSEPYEPGSTYKSITVAIALEEKAVSETERFSDEPIYVGDWKDYPIKCSIYPLNHGNETMEQGLWNSCNPVMAQVAERIGIKTFYNYVQAFGHLAPTGIDLPAEAVGMNHADDPNVVDLAVWSFGEQSTITPIQLINAYCALGNGGALMKPRLAQAATDDTGRVVRQFPPEQIRRVISENTAKKVREYMRGVITKGTAHSAEIPGYQPCGKSSTSCHGPDDEQVDVSFCMLAPKDDPVVATLVVMYEPEPVIYSQPTQYACARITEKAMHVLGVQPAYTPEDYHTLQNGKYVSTYTGMTLHDAQTDIVEGDMTVVVDPDEDFNPWSKTQVVYQYPAPDTRVTGKASVYVTTKANHQPLPQVTVPDFSGKTIAEAMDMAEAANLNIHWVGGDMSGSVVSQSHAAGESVQKYTVIDIGFGGR